jgi:hypothetical protein
VLGWVIISPVMIAVRTVAAMQRLTAITPCCMVVMYRSVQAWCPDVCWQQALNALTLAEGSI